MKHIKWHLILPLFLALILCFLASCSGECKHESSDWIVDKEASCKELGLRHKECIKCHEILESESYSAGHRFENGICAVCGEPQYGPEYMFFEEVTIDGVKGYSVKSVGNCSAVHIVVPETHRKLPVIAISPKAFAGDVHLLSIRIPKEIRSVGADAFYGCTAMDTILFDAESLCTYIGPRAFSKTAITKMNLPKQLEGISVSLFANCEALAEVTLPKAISYVGTDAFDGCDKLVWNEKNQMGYLGNEENPYLLLMKVLDKSLSAYPIESTTTAIYAYAFAGCTNLTSFTVPDGIFSIGSAAFSGCTKLKQIQLPSSLREVGSYAFSGCTSLTSATVPAGVTDLGACAFRDCKALTAVSLPATLKRVGAALFFGCDALSLTHYEGAVYSGNAENPYLILLESDVDATAVQVHENTLIIADSAFAGRAKLATLTISAAVKYIGTFTCNGCGTLNHVTFAVKEGWSVQNAATGEIKTPAVTDGTGGAELLKKTYLNYYWFR